MPNLTEIAHQLYQPKEDELPPENHLAFAVENLDAYCQSLRQGGYTIEIPPAGYYWGRSAYLRDPDGHLIELSELGEGENERS